MILQGAAGGEQSATATAERLGGQSETLQGATAELKRQLEQQSSQLSSQAAEVGTTRQKLQVTQVSSHVFVPMGSLADLQMTVECVRQEMCCTEDFHVIQQNVSNMSAASASQVHFVGAFFLKAEMDEVLQCDFLQPRMCLCAMFRLPAKPWRRPMEALRGWARSFR